MLREYELMYIVRPELDDDAVRSATESVQSLVENTGGEVTKTTPWGKRRLAYEVQHLRDGHYVLAQLRLEPDRVADLERALRISDTVFRHLLVVDESVATPDDVEPGGPAADAGAPAPPAGDTPEAVSTAEPGSTPEAEGASGAEGASEAEATADESTAGDTPATAGGGAESSSAPTTTAASSPEEV